MPSSWREISGAAWAEGSETRRVRGQSRRSKGGKEGKERMAEDIEEILAEIDESTMEEYQKFFNLFDKDKKGYIMAIQVGQVMDAMEQEYDDKMMRKTIKK